MTKFVVRWHQDGDSIHASLYTAVPDAMALALNGRLIFSEEEWNGFQRQFQAHIVKDDSHGGEGRAG